VAIPIFAGMCFYVYGYLSLNPSAIYPGQNYITLVTLRAAQTCYLLVIIYGLFSIAFSVERFRKKNHANIATEFEFTKTCLFIGVTILVILIIIARLFTYFQINAELLSHYFILYDLSFAILAASIIAVIGAFLRIVVYTTRKEFRLYLAKGYCKIAWRKSSLDKIKYLFLSIDSYNKFLLRKTKFGIKNIDKIYSDIISTDVKKNDEIIRSVGEQLDGEELDLAIRLSQIYKVQDTEQFFIKETIVQRLKTIAVFLAATIPIVISVVRLFTGSG
jgi:hypothetical protein